MNNNHKSVVDSYVTKNVFDHIDYCVFSFMLIGSATVGFYYGLGYGCNKQNHNNNKQSADEEQSSSSHHLPLKSKDESADESQQPTNHSKTTEYLLGNKQMSPLPVGLSLISSYISAVTVLGTPAEIYNYGTQYFLLFISIWLMGLVVSQVYLPVYFKLNVKSSYEYLEYRFNKYVRTLVCILFILDEIMFLPMLVYVPSLAFEQVTGINLHFVSWVVTGICVFYTFVGGLKAVIWTDTWQIMVMVLSALAIAICGTSTVGGFEQLWHRAEEGGRLIFFNFSGDVTERQTIWSVLIGGFMFWTSYNACHQTMVQRYVSLPTIRESKIAIAIFTVGVSFFVLMCSYTGLVIYAAYHNCDPIEAKICRTDDQMLPAFVTNFLGHIPGIAGLFIAGLFGAGLSSLSVILNSTAIVFLEDIVKSLFCVELSDRSAKIFAKCVILILGLHTICGVFIVQNLGGVLSVATSLNAIASGTTFGLFSLGMLVPQSNTAGALAGGISGALVSATISIGTQYLQAKHLISPPHTKLPISVSECMISNISALNSSSAAISNLDESQIPIIFRMSYLWVSPIGFITVITIGTIVSLLTRKQTDECVNPDYISPVLHPFLSKKHQQIRSDDNDQNDAS